MPEKAREAVQGSLFGDPPAVLDTIPYMVGHVEHISVQFSPSAFPDSDYSLEIVTAETCMRLAKVINDVYVSARKEDGACARCFLIRLSQSLEGEGWEILQELEEKGRTHGKACTNLP